MTLIPLKITSWTMGKGIKPIRGLEVNLIPPSHHLGLSKFGWERVGLNGKLCSMFLKLNLLVSGTFILATLDIWQVIKLISLLLKTIMVELLPLEMEA